MYFPNPADLRRLTEFETTQDSISTSGQIFPGMIIRWQRNWRMAKKDHGVSRTGRKCVRICHPRTTLESSASDLREVALIVSIRLLSIVKESTCTVFDLAKTRSFIGSWWKSHLVPITSST